MEVIIKTSTPDYHFWLKLERVQLKQICLLAKGQIPDMAGEVLYRLEYETCPIYITLLSGIETNEIKSSKGKASPLACFLYLQEKGINLPVDLTKVLKEDLRSFQAGFKTKIRTKETYQRTEIRGDEPILEAILKTLLDLYPNLPKEQLIFLKPVQEYANGKNHSQQKLKKMIEAIEGKKRKPGNIHKQKVQEISRTIPKNWVEPYSDCN